MINPDFIKLLKSFCEDEQEIVEGLFFGFLIENREEFPLLNDYLLNGNKSIFPYEKFQEYAINLCRKDIDNNINTLKVPLYGISISEDYKNFLIALSERNISSKGHVNNPLKFTIFSKEDGQAFERIKQILGKDFDLNTLADIIEEYYESTSYASKLANYLDTGAQMDYMQKIS